MPALAFNQTDFPSRSRLIVRILGQLRLAEVNVLEYSPSGKLVKLQIEPLDNGTARYWRELQTDWELVEKLASNFGS